METESARNGISEIERIVGRDVGRGIQMLAEHARGGLLTAARSIAEHATPHVAVMTGYYVPWAARPAAESDGPVGAAHILAALDRVGVPCRAVTDAPCAGAVKAALLAAGVGEAVPLDIVAIPDTPFPEGRPLPVVLESWRRSDPPLSHVLSIKRIGPARDGKPRNFRGDDIGASNAPLERLFMGGPWETIGMGDGGNELGMGSIPADVIAADVANGGAIASVVPADHLIVLGVSNWGGYGLPAALGLLRSDWRAAMLEELVPERDHEILLRVVEDGPAVDGIEGVQAIQADGHPWPFHAEVLALVRAILERSD